MQGKNLNQKGLLFTIMTLFLIFGIITLNTALSDTAKTFSPSKEAILLYTVGNSFRNASSIMLDLDKNGYARESLENIYPFSYSLEKDANIFSLAQEFSLNDNQIDEVFDYLNTSAVLLTDKDYSKAYSGVEIDINSPKNAHWLGSDGTVSFLILPFCYAYTLEGQSVSSFGSTTSSACDSVFDNSKIKRIDINITVLASTSDFTSFTCDGAACPTDSFNPASADPYYNITIIDSNCDSCSIPQKTASSHFLANSAHAFELKCVGATCVSPTLLINIDSLDLNYAYFSEQKLNISTKFTFNERPSGFVVKNVSITAKSPFGTVEKKSD